MKIFKSLNCIVCESPFARIANPPRSLDCGKAMCDGCFRREESTELSERKHQCEEGIKCLWKRKFAHFLIDILSLDSLKLSPKGDGYLLCKPFKLPKCPICHDEYSRTLSGKSPFGLWECHHIICTNCYEKTRNLNKGSNKDRWPYQIECPICSVKTFTDVDNSNGDFMDEFQSKHFLAELPEMTRQLEEMDRAANRFCEECKKEAPVEDAFYCEECEKSICANCAVKKHKSHTTPTILEMEATKILDQLQKDSIVKVNTYENLFPERHKEVLDDIGILRKKLLSKKENLKLASNYEDLQKKREKYTQLNTKFEDTSTLYGIYLQQYNAEIKDLIKYLDDDIN